MKTFFYGHMYIYLNSVEGKVKYFYTSSYKSLLSAMLQYLVDEKHIDAKDYDLSFSNAIDFITEGIGASACVGGSSEEKDLVSLLNDLVNDNISVPEGYDGTFVYKAPQGGIVREDNLVMTILYNLNFKDEGYENCYHTIIGRSLDELKKDFLHWANLEFFDPHVHFPNHIDKTIALLNKKHPEGNLYGGLNMKYYIENVKGDMIKKESIL